MALNTLPAGAFADSAITSSKINLANNFAFTGTVTGASDFEKITETVLTSDASSVEFTSAGTPNIFDTKYRKLCFHFTNMRGVAGSSSNYNLKFNVSTDGGSNYNIAKTSTYFLAVHSEGGAGASLTYEGTYDLANSTSDANIQVIIGDDTDKGNGSQFWLEQPHSTTSKKSYFCIGSTMTGNNTYNYFNATSGYCQTTSAINAIRFIVYQGGGSTNGVSDGSIISVYGVK